MTGQRHFFSYYLGAAALLGAGALAAILFLLPAAPGKMAPSPGTATHISPEQRLQVQQNLSRQPLHFIENRGQVDPQVKFYARGRDQTICFTRQGLRFSLVKGKLQEGRDQSKAHPAKPAAVQTAAVALTPLGLSRKLELMALEPQETRVNYFIGNDPQKWHTDIPTYKAVVYKEAYPGIDLKFYGAGQQLEYDIIVKPGADPGRVKFQYAGIRSLKVTPAGDLAILLPDGSELVQKKPVVYQEIAGQRVAREAKFKLRGALAQHTFGFEVAAYDRKAPLIIDPVLVYSTYWGGNNADEGFGVAVDASGNAYVTGVTWSDFGGILAPRSASNAAGISPRRGPDDVFVMKFSPYGHLLFFTLLGGSGSEEGHGIAVDADGSAYVTGWTDSFDFPCINSDIAQNGQGSKDAFVARIHPLGNSLVWSTIVGGIMADGGAGIALGPLSPEGGQPYVYVTGWANSETFGFSPQTPPSPLYPYHGGGDAFVVKISQYYSVLQDIRVKAAYYTFLGGSYGKEEAYGIAVDAAGNAYITGVTFSTDMPVYPSAYAFHGAGDAFVAKINDSGVMWSICLGGNGLDMGNAIAIDVNNYLYITGITYSSSFAGLTPSLFTYGGGEDAFVVKIRQVPTFPSGVLVPSPVYFTYLGGTGTDEGRGIGVDSSGNAYVTGATDSPNFPTKDPLPIKPAQTDAFVTKINAAGTALVYSTYLGGSYLDCGNSIAVQPSGVAVVTGKTDSRDFPSRAALQSIFNGNFDAFVTSLAPQPLHPVPLPGLLAFYPFDGATEAETLKDASGNGNDATLSGASPRTYGFEGQTSWGQSYSFNGVNNYIRAPVNINPSQCPQLTMGAWVKVSSLPTQRTQVLSSDNGGFDRSIGVDYSGAIAYWSVFCGSTGVMGGPPLETDKWFFVAAVYDQTTRMVKFWVNDQVVTLIGANLGEGFNYLDIGRNPGFGEYFAGDIDNVFIYNRALTDAQIAFIRDGGAYAILKGQRLGTTAPVLELLLLQ